MTLSFYRSYALLALLVLAFGVAEGQQRYTRGDLWEKEIEAFEAADREKRPGSGGVLFVGSSSIRVWKTAESDFADLKAVNRGFGGSHIEDVIFYVPRIVLPYKPKLIVLYAGENDLTAGKTVDRVFRDFEDFVSLIHDRLPKTRIIFISLKPSPSRWNLRGQFQQLNGLIEAKIKRDKRMKYVDVWPSMLDADGEPRKDIFQADGLHMNPEGYKIWRELLAPPIRRGMAGKFR